MARARAALSSTSCSLCRHPRRVDIESQAKRGRAFEDIARDFGTRADLVAKHLLHADQKHAGPQRKIVTKLDTLVERADVILDRAINAGDFRSSSSLIRELRATLLSIGQSTGEIVHRTIRTVLDRHGLKDEAELDRIIEAHRAQEGLTLEDLLRDGIQLLKFVIEQHPEYLADVQAAFDPKQLPRPEPSGAEVLEDEAPLLEV